MCGTVLYFLPSPEMRSVVEQEQENEAASPATKPETLAGVEVAGRRRDDRIRSGRQRWYGRSGAVGWGWKYACAVGMVRRWWWVIHRQDVPPIMSVDAAVGIDQI